MHEQPQDWAVLGDVVESAPPPRRPRLRRAVLVTAAVLALVGWLVLPARHEGARHVVVKGGHLSASESTDLLFDGTRVELFRAERIATRNNHGTGCTFASAIAAFTGANS